MRNGHIYAVNVLDNEGEHSNALTYLSTFFDSNIHILINSKYRVTSINNKSTEIRFK